MSAEYGVDPDLVRAIIYEEQSHLTPDEALGREQIFPEWGSGGVGVMQVSGSVGAKLNYSKTELARNSSSNIRAGVSHLSDIQKQYNTTDPGRVATVYNCADCTGVTSYGQRVAGQMASQSFSAGADIRGLISTLKPYMTSSVQKVLTNLGI